MPEAGPDPGRRRILALIGALVGLGAGGWAVGSLRRDTISNRLSADAASQASTPIVTTSTTRSPSSTTSSSTTATSTSTTTTSTSTTATAPQPLLVAVICKEAWGIGEPAGEFEEHTIERMTVHHTAAVLAANRDAPGRARQHQAYHMSRGWPDLAYHYLVDAEGYVYEGRPVWARGDTGTEYDPTGHFLVCMEGDFDQQDVPEAQWQRIADVLAWGASEFGVDPATIAGHRDYAATSCPGDNAYPFVADGSLLRLTQERLAAGGVELVTVCGDEAAMRLEAIEA